LKKLTPKSQRHRTASRFSLSRRPQEKVQLPVSPTIFKRPLGNLYKIKLKPKILSSFKLIKRTFKMLMRLANSLLMTNLSKDREKMHRKLQREEGHPIKGKFRTIRSKNSSPKDKRYLGHLSNTMR
jgi:hypothetical protein